MATIHKPDAADARGGTATLGWWLPVRVRALPNAVYRWSAALAAVAGAGAAAGVLFPDIFRDPDATVGSARGTALVMLLVAIPAMLGAMALAARGSVRAPVVWLGALGFILYNSVVYAFGVSFNGLFLVYVAALSLAFWSLVALLRAVDVEGLRAGVASGMPVRGIAGYLLVTTALFFLVWMGDDVPATLHNSTPKGLDGTVMLTNPFHVVDLGFFFPLTALAAIWLWQRRPWGFLLAGAFLVYGTIEAVSVATDQWLAHVHDDTYSADAVPLFVVLGLISLVPLALYFRHFRGAPASEPR